MADAFCQSSRTRPGRVSNSPSPGSHPDDAEFASVGMLPQSAKVGHCVI
jgi:hypothetical protein